MTAVPEVPLTEKLALNPEEVEALTGISSRHVRDCIREGLVARVRHTSRVLVARSELDRWLATEQQAAA